MRWLDLALLLAISVLAAAASAAENDDSSAVKSQFDQPPRQYAPAPLWVWNERLTDEQVRGTLRDLAGQSVKQAFVHPRPGLVTPYLSDEWFRLWKVALDEAERLDMNLWIYDENSYPSGFAGGWVPELMPEARAQTLVFRETKQVEPHADIVAVFRITGEVFDDVTKELASGKLLAGRYLVAQIQWTKPLPWNGNRPYVDLLRPGVTEKFLEVTLEAYRKQLGDQFGKRIPGSFTDEPHLQAGGGVAWSDRMFDRFEHRFGYSLRPNLPSLVRETGDWRRVRHNFMQFLHEQFVEHWAKPYYEYCEKHQLEFTGHYWEHSWPQCASVPDNMAMYAWHQRPAIDCLMNQYKEDVHAQFGNVRIVKELASVANQMGRRRTLCEAYGAGGWDLRFEDMKRIGDWLYVLGVNTMDEHLSYVSIRGARKRDHPQSFSYHEPWWNDYHVLARYYTRLSLALSSGQQVNHTVVLQPTTTAWMYQFAPKGVAKDKLDELGNAFQSLVTDLEKAQVEFDLACEPMMADHGSVKVESGSAKLVIGRRAYDLVILPPGAENLNSSTHRLLDKYAAAGGRVLACGAAPAYLDGQPSKVVAGLAAKPGWQTVPTHAAIEAAAKATRDRFLLEKTAADGAVLYHHRRQLADGQIVFLVNTSIDAATAGRFEAAGQSVELWNPVDGSTRPYPYQAATGKVRGEFALAPCGSLLLFVGTKPGTAAPAARAPQVAEMPAAGPVEVRRAEPNVLTLDYVDVEAGSKSLTNSYFYPAQQFVFQANGFDRNPWDSAVQFREEILKTKIPAESGFSATYRFRIERAVPRQLWFALERADLYTVRCNDQPVAAIPGQWWLDRAFAKLNLAGLAKVGENRVTITARPFTVFHELEPAYLLGDFSLRAGDRGFVVESDQGLSLRADGWNRQGHPFYAGPVVYRQSFVVAKKAGAYRVALGAWYGSVARVSVNGKPSGAIFHQPWQCDVTDAVIEGKNVVEVAVVGTLKNTLGPHHGNVQLGTAWPRMFQQGPKEGPPPGAEYNTVGYGLFAPAVLQAVRP